MTFTSYYFFAFLAVVLLLFRLLPWKLGRWVLLLASYFFYGNANPLYILLLLASTVTDYLVGLQLVKTDVQRQRKKLVWLSVFVNIGLLAFFKYGDFVIENFNTAFRFFSNYQLGYLHLELPVGISFYTFQTLAYTVDVYRKRVEPCRDPVQFGLFVAFFPQLVAGPIERASVLLPQMSQRQPMTAENFMSGVQRILWGLVKKMVFADRLVVYLNEVYQQPESMSASVLVLAAVAFPMQLYLDFSAYTDIAIGIARIMGIKLTENFKHPLAARNPSQFWGGWHVTLTRWFRDYVFVPLGGVVRNNPLRSIFNTVLLLTLIGLWHGATWNFVLFGFIGGVFTVLFQVLRTRQGRKQTGYLMGDSILGWIVACLLLQIAISSISVLFRAPDLQAATAVWRGILTKSWAMPSYYYLYVWLTLMLFVIHFLRHHFEPRWKQWEDLLPKTITTFALLIVLVFAAYEYQETFAYFQF